MKTRKNLLVLLLATFCMPFAFAQKNLVKSAERIAQKKDANFDEARQLIGQALQNPETANEAQTFYVAGFIEQNYFTQENIKQTRGIEPDRAKMNQALLDMFGYYQKSKELDNKPNEKGKVRPKYTKNILKAYEENHLYYINAGSYFMENEQFDKALQAFQCFQTIKAQPEYAEKPMSVPDSNSMLVDFFAVITAYQANQKDLAIDMAKKIQDVPYRQNDLLQVLAQTQIEQTDTLGYIETMKKGLDLFPDEPYYSVNLINTYIGQGKNDLAIETLEQAIAKSPNNPQLYNVMGKLHENSGREDEALQCFEQALQVDPNYGEANYDMGRVIYNQAVTIKSGEIQNAETDKKAEELFKKALPYLLKAYEADPDQSYYILANVYYQLGMDEEYKAIMSKHQ